MDDDFFSQSNESEEAEFKPLHQRIQECLSIESEDAMVLKLKSCLQDLVSSNKRSAASSSSKKSQWYTW